MVIHGLDDLGGTRMISETFNMVIQWMNDVYNDILVYNLAFIGNSCQAEWES